MENKIELNVSEGTKEVIIRNGDAPILKEPRVVSIKGDINAPGEFFKKRTSKIDLLRSHVEVDYQNFSIKLIVNEDNHYASTIEGSLVLFPELSKLKINENKTYSPRELYDALKFNAGYFKNREQHNALCGKLIKFTSRIEVDFVNTNDFKGNIAHSKLTKIKTELDLKFILAIPVFKGVEPSVFEVEICLDTKDSGVICWLESVELHELKTDISKEAMKKSLNELSEFVIINV